MVNCLQRIKLNCQEYYIDERLQEVRNVLVPWESISFKEVCDNPEEYNLDPENNKEDKKTYEFVEEKKKMMKKSQYREKFDALAAEIEINGTPASPATAFASIVFPVPGGPIKSAPLGILAPS